MPGDALGSLLTAQPGSSRKPKEGVWGTDPASLALAAVSHGGTDRSRTRKVAHHTCQLCPGCTLRRTTTRPGPGVGPEA